MPKKTKIEKKLNVFDAERLKSLRENVEKFDIGTPERKAAHEEYCKELSMYVEMDAKKNERRDHSWVAPLITGVTGVVTTAAGIWANGKYLATALEFEETGHFVAGQAGKQVLGRVFRK